MASSAILCLLAPAVAARASAPVGAGIVARDAAGTYTLWVLSEQRGINDVSLTLPAGTSIRILGDPGACSVHGSTVFCYPRWVPAGRPTNVVRFVTRPRITQSTKLVLMFAGPKATGPPVPVAYLSRPANIATALAALAP